MWKQQKCWSCVSYVVLFPPFWHTCLHLWNKHTTCAHTQILFCTHATLLLQSVSNARTSGLSSPCRTNLESWCQLWQIIPRVDNSRFLSYRSTVSHGSSICKECFIFDSGMQYLCHRKYLSQFPYVVTIVALIYGILECKYLICSNLRNELFLNFKKCSNQWNASEQKYGSIVLSS